MKKLIWLIWLLAIIGYISLVACCVTTAFNGCQTFYSAIFRVSTLLFFYIVWAVIGVSLVKEILK